MKKKLLPIFFLTQLLTISMLTNSIAQDDFLKSRFIGNNYTIGDFNKDSKPDVFVSEYLSFGESQLYALINQCDSNEVVFDTINISKQNDLVGPHSIGDFDSDGNVDIFYQKGDSSEMQLLLNKGDLSFEHIELGLNHSFLNELVDIDMDGDNDILGINFQQGGLYLFVNNGNYNFQSYRPLENDRYISSKLPVDIDSDGDMDIVVGMQSWDDRQMIFLINEGNYEFTEIEVELEFSDDDVEHLKLYDYNEDGLFDIIYQDETKLVAMINKGNGEYEELKIIPADNADYYPFGEYQFGDVNNDGKTDIVTGGKVTFSPYPLNFFLNESDDPLNPTYSIFEVGRVSPSSRIDLIDIDCDQDLDIMVNNGGTDNWIFQNQFDSSVSTHKINLPKFTVFPNPAIDEINISSSTEKLESLTIFNVLGYVEEIHETDFKTLSVSHIPAGLYFLHIKTKLGIIYSSFVKK